MFSNKKFSRGFSLVELLVVMAIFIVITSVVLYNQTKFSSDISISNVAYSIALQVRQAQVYGILVRQGATDFNTAYGIHFSKTGGAITFDLFSDDNKNLTYDAGTDSIIKSQQLGEGNVIYKVCTYNGSLGNEQCINSGAGSTISWADVVFKRPDPAARISDSQATPNTGRIDVVIRSSLGDRQRIVQIAASGQVSVGPTTPPTS